MVRGEPAGPRGPLIRNPRTSGTLAHLTLMRRPVSIMPVAAARRQGY